MLLMIVLIHITSCIWIMFPSFMSDDDEEKEDGQEVILTGTWL